MLTPEELERVADTLIPIWDRLKEWITLDIIDRIIARLGRGEDISFSATDIWQMQVYEDAGGFIEALQQKVIETTKVSEQEVKRIFLDYGSQAVQRDNEVFKTAKESTENITPKSPGNSPIASEIAGPNKLPVEPQSEPQSEEKPLDNISDRMKEIMQDAYERTNGELRNFTRTTAYSTQQELIKELDNAYLKVVSGAQSQWAVAQEAVNNIIKHQGYVTYPSGHVDTIEVAVIRAIRTGVARMSAALAVEEAKEYGWNHVLVSSHLGARTGDGTESPGNHAWWQGKVYTIDGENEVKVDNKTVFAPNLEEATGYPSDPTGLCGYNCRHNLTPFKSGMSNPFKEYDSEENKKAYDLSQQQRAYERKIRKTKTEVMALSEAIKNCKDDNLCASLTEKLNAAKTWRDKLTSEYTDFCKENDLKTSYERMYVARGLRTIESKTNNVVAKSAESGIIKEKKYSEEEELPRKVKDENFSVNWNVIQTQEYSDKFKQLSDNEKVSSAVETRAKWALNNRDGAKTEELYAISLKDGREISRITNQNYDSAVKRTDKFTRELNEADKSGEKILLLHNHPKGLPPSISDINSLLVNKNATGITVGHDGSVYYYSRPIEEIPIDDWNVAMRHFNQYSEITAMERSLALLSEKYVFSIIKL